MQSMITCILMHQDHEVGLQPASHLKRCIWTVTKACLNLQPGTARITPCTTSSAPPVKLHRHMVQSVPLTPPDMSYCCVCQYCLIHGTMIDTACCRIPNDLELPRSYNTYFAGRGSRR